MNGETCDLLALKRDRIIEEDILTSCRVQSAATSFAFKVLSLLMGDEDLKVIEITLTL